ncbi:hypothetical protein K474DRAFT_1706957 [Panus rudis PR-1116 ss-1]|nr:hypothetical protein K474DRAFT_1706957 [Panus rudis PR-1116 ss-1]
MGVFDDDIGALLIGQIVSTFLYGITTLQMYTYLTKYPHDKRELKLWVGLIWVIDTVNVVLGAQFCPLTRHLVMSTPRLRLTELRLGIAQFGQSLLETDNPKTDAGKRSFDISAGLNSAVSPEGIRYWTILVLAHFGFGSAAIVKVIEALSVHGRQPLSKLTLSTIIPYTQENSSHKVRINVSRTAREIAGFSDLSLNDIIDRAIQFAFTRCLLVAACALTRLITFAAIPQAMWFVATDFAMGKLYAVSLMSMLNSRPVDHKLVQQTGDTSDPAVFSSVLSFPTSTELPTIDMRSPQTPHNSFSQTMGHLDIESQADSSSKRMHTIKSKSRPAT